MKKCYRIGLWSNDLFIWCIQVKKKKEKENKHTMTGQKHRKSFCSTYHYPSKTSNLLSLMVSYLVTPSRFKCLHHISLYLCFNLSNWLLMDVVLIRCYTSLFVLSFLLSVCLSLYIPYFTLFSLIQGCAVFSIGMLKLVRNN